VGKKAEARRLMAKKREGSYSVSWAAGGVELFLRFISSGKNTAPLYPALAEKGEREGEGLSFWT